MSFAGEENSRKDGSPVEIYDLVQGDDSWHFTTGSAPVTIDSVLYDPFPVVREGINSDDDRQLGQFHITLPDNHEFVQRYINVLRPEPASVRIRRFHRYDDDTELWQMTAGLVYAVNFVGDGTAQVAITPGTDRTQMQIPRFVYSGLCGHVLGDRWCNADGTVDLETGNDANGLPLKHVGTVSSYDPATGIIKVGGIESAGYPEDYFASGMIKLPFNGDVRLAVSSGHNGGDSLRVYIPFFQDPTGHSASVYAGCSHDILTCENKFQNAVNHGGFATIPGTNPFVSSPFVGLIPADSDD